jgi:hypothetical protein
MSLYQDKSYLFWGGGRRRLNGTNYGMYKSINKLNKI